jgi:WD40 repeat protein
LNLCLYFDELARREEWDDLFSALGFLAPKLRSELFTRLKQSEYRPQNPIAARLWTEGAELDSFALWSRPPWKALAGADVEVLADALNHDYVGVCEVIDAHPERHQELLALADRGHRPALWQWIQDREVFAPFGEPGYKASWLLTKRPLPLEDLALFLDTEYWEQAVTWQLRQSELLPTLALFLQENFTKWEWLPKATTDVEIVLLNLAESGRCERDLLRRACLGEPGAVIELWERERYPALKKWWIDEGWCAPGLAELLLRGTSESASTDMLLWALWDPEPAIAKAALEQLKGRHNLADACKQLKYPYLATEMLRPTELWTDELEKQYPQPARPGLPELTELGPEKAWRLLCQAPLLQSSQSLRRLISNNYRPLHRPDLFDKMSDLVEAGPLFAIALEWMTFPHKADWIGQDGQTIFGYSSVEGTFWVARSGGETQIIRPQVMGSLSLISAYEIDGGYLLRDKSKLLCLNQEGECRWSRETSHELLTFSPDRNRIALAQGSELKVLATHSGEVIGHGSLEMEQPERNRGPVWVVASGPSGRAIAWSEDGRWIATHHLNFTFVWDAETLQLHRKLSQLASVTWLGFHQSRLLTTTSSSLGSAIFVMHDTTLFIWDPDSGECLANPSGLSAIGAAIFDGSTLLLQGKDSLYTLRFSEAVVPDISTAEFSLEARLVGFRHGLALFAHHKGDYDLVDPGRGEVLNRLGSYKNCILLPDSRKLLSLDDSLRSTSLLDTRVISELDTSKLTRSAAKYGSLALEVLG